MHPSYVPRTIPYSGIPLPSTGSRPMSVPPLRRYYQDATTSCLPFRRFTLPHWSCSAFPSLGGTTVASSVRSFVTEGAKATRPGVFSLWPGHSVEAACIRGEGRTSQVPAEPQSPVCTCSSTPAEPTRGSPIASRSAWPPLREPRGLQQMDFRSSITRLPGSLSTLRSPGYPGTTQDSLPVGG